MKSILPILAVLIVLGCGPEPQAPDDPNAKYRDAPLTVGMSIEEIKLNLGEPDRYSSRWAKFPDPSTPFWSGYKQQGYEHHIEELGYGPFGAYSQKVGHTTKYRLDMTFLDGKLSTWSKSAPPDEAVIAPEN